MLKWIDQAESYQRTAQALTTKEISQYDFLLSIGLRMLAGAAHENLQKHGFKR